MEAKAPFARRIRLLQQAGHGDDTWPDSVVADALRTGTYAITVTRLLVELWQARRADPELLAQSPGQRSTAYASPRHPAPAPPVPASAGDVMPKPPLSSRSEGPA